MSYILDALKKSDKERQRKRSVPDLDTVPLEPVPQKKKKASWPIPLAAILLVNAIFIFYFAKPQNQPVQETKDIDNISDRAQQETVQAGQQAVVSQTTPVPLPAGDTPLETGPAAAEDTSTVALIGHDPASRQEPVSAPPLAPGERAGRKMDKDGDTAESRESDSEAQVANMAPHVTPGASPVSSEAVQSEPVAVDDESAVTRLAEDDTSPGPEPASETPLSRGESAAGRIMLDEDAQAADNREDESETASMDPQEDVAVASESETPAVVDQPEEYNEKPEQDQAQHPRLAETADSGPSEPQAGLMKKAVHFNQLPAAIRNQLPDIHIGAHLFYKDKPASRLASINGKILREGQMFDQDLKVAEISTDGVIFSYQKYLFYMPVF